ncbi:hypothetical protein QA255_004581 [Salmonella enterica]|uniref:Uncharacterized protein n=2 Tax=Escherichia coli TaxID=562 RepID=A0A8H9SNP7_ECOLX|nr:MULTISPECIES: hypothetical protein [Enterobacteriaceae]EEC5789196.1 hypothetical protein [Salmonella enterica subsp. enterica serovar Give]EEZ6622940.1 hypothetical protein [Escherichia coli O7]EFB7119480.1 hypothetical protein [Salmonella enterica subsp. enterica serovar Infantis]EGC7237139.1 hypothetical protein [Salmonella enterica]EGH0863988.1 hypothetical protein [Salmonella enterica subsp. enterica serovar Derby]EGN4536429.1 hypothetical protein [Salmonella enterica subsp. enterica s
MNIAVTDTAIPVLFLPFLFPLRTNECLEIIAASVTPLIGQAASNKLSYLGIGKKISFDGDLINGTCISGILNIAAHNE